MKKLKLLDEKTQGFFFEKLKLFGFKTQRYGSGPLHPTTKISKILQYHPIPIQSPTRIPETLIPEFTTIPEKSATTKLFIY